MYGKITSIETVQGFQLGNSPQMDGSGGARLGLGGMINILADRRSMDGYKVTTKKNIILVLIDNDQSCCESWGYMSSEDDMQSFVGANLRDVVLTDTALKSLSVDENLKYLDCGGVQFVNFETSRGTLQLAVYNAHNGYYGHGIIVAIDNKIICDNTI
jgi:hypothetical protein